MQGPGSSLLQKEVLKLFGNLPSLPPSSHVTLVTLLNLPGTFLSLSSLNCQIEIIKVFTLQSSYKDNTHKGLNRIPTAQPKGWLL